ncbi:MAG: DNA-processing protein DprA [Pseudomonadota bacterium]
MSPTRTLSDDERLDWLRLARTPRVGPVTFDRLMTRFGSAREALAALPGFGAKRPNPPPVDEIKREIDATVDYGARLVCAIEPDFPALLRALGPPPPVLTCLGKIALGSAPSVAMVGARDASAAGRKLARDIAVQLGLNGLVTVSGLARGIDGEVHAASLATGTVAVLGGGIDHIYPPQHERLYAAIAGEGLIITESPFGYRAQARDFPRRNRIITGLAVGTVVIEAAERSGSLISARTAGEQGREVMAVPGSPLDPRAAGTNRLLRDGAVLVRNADDIIEAISDLSQAGMRAPPPPTYVSEPGSDDDLPTEQIDAVHQALSPAPMPIDELARAAGIGAGRCAAILMELELLGEAETLPGGLACRAAA